jgi:hypothetical protein
LCPDENKDLNKNQLNKDINFITLQKEMNKYSQDRNLIVCFTFYCYPYILTNEIKVFVYVLTFINFEDIMKRELIQDSVKSVYVAYKTRREKVILYNSWYAAVKSLWSITMLNSYSTFSRTLFNV